MVKLIKLLSSLFKTKEFVNTDFFLFAMSHYNSLNSSSSRSIILNSNEADMDSNNLSYIGDWCYYEDKQGKQTVDDIEALLKNNLLKLTQLRSKPVIAYITNISNSNNPHEISISEEDIEHFINLIKTIPKNIKEIDLILHSLGGSTVATLRIVSLLICQPYITQRI